MAYRLVDADVSTEVRRIAHEQIGKAIADLDDIDRIGVVEAVHDARKRCKKVRGLVRLVRPAMDDQYEKANRTFRDAARTVSGLRDSHALIATFDEMVAASVGEVPDGLGPVRAGLEGRRDRSTDGVDGRDDRIAAARDLLEAGRDRIDGWTLDADGWPAVAGGVHKTYGRGREALADAIDRPSPERFHETRKRVKYTWYHLRLLGPTAPSVLSPLANAFHDLANALGDAHDLAVLRERLVAVPGEYGGEGAVDAAVRLADGHRVALERRAVGLASRLYVEPPERFTKRLGGYWSCWEEHGSERDAGEIGDLFDRPDDGLSSMTVVELQGLARAARVPGRSKRNRADLIASLRAHGVSSGSRNQM